MKNLFVKFGMLVAFAVFFTSCQYYPVGPDLCTLGWEECNKLATRQACERQGGSSIDCFSLSQGVPSELEGPPEQEAEPLEVIVQPEEVEAEIEEVVESESRSLFPGAYARYIRSLSDSKITGLIDELYFEIISTSEEIYVLRREYIEGKLHHEGEYLYVRSDCLNCVFTFVHDPPLTGLRYDFPESDHNSAHSYEPVELTFSVGDESFEAWQYKTAYIQYRVNEMGETSCNSMHETLIYGKYSSLKLLQVWEWSSSDECPDPYLSPGTLTTQLVDTNIPLGP